MTSSPFVMILVSKPLSSPSELVQLKLNIETSVGDFTPTEAECGAHPLIEVGVSELITL
ncbi:hypothetical protein JCM17380_50510 [Desulfosporosinus burensis]